MGGPPDPVIADALASIQPQQQLVAEPLVALDELRREPWLSANHLAGPLGRPVVEVTSLMHGWRNQLRTDGDGHVFELLETDRGTGIQLSTPMRDALADRIAWLPLRREIVADSIVAYARWAGRVARRDVAALFDIADVTATSWLSAMADEGLLDIGVRAGRYAHYLPPDADA